MASIPTDRIFCGHPVYLANLQVKPVQMTLRMYLSKLCTKMRVEGGCPNSIFRKWPPVLLTYRTSHFWTIFYFKLSIFSFHSQTILPYCESDGTFAQHIFSVVRVATVLRVIDTQTRVDLSRPCRSIIKRPVSVFLQCKYEKKQD